MEIKTETKPIGAYRKDLYRLFEDIIGRKMKDAEHDTLKKIFLQCLAEHQIISSPDAKPLEHRITCPKCQGVKMKKGYAFKNYKRSIKKSGGDSTDHAMPKM